MTPEETKIQMAIGSAEMVLGLAGLLGTKGKGVGVGLVIMADGGTLVGKGFQHEKATLGSMALELITSFVDANGVPFAPLFP